MNGGPKLGLVASTPAFMLKGPGIAGMPGTEDHAGGANPTLSSWISGPAQLWSARLNFGIRQEVGGKPSICTALLLPPGSGRNSGDIAASKCVTGMTPQSHSLSEENSSTDRVTQPIVLECSYGSPSDDEDWVE